MGGVVEHVSRQSGAAWARLETVDAPSPARRPPACPAFGACGGCVLQHLAYDAQLVWKRTRVARALAEHPALADVKVDACVASPRPLGYRNRSKLVVARREEGRPDDGLVLGAYAPRSHDVVDLAGCRIAEPPLDETAAALRALLDEAGVRAYDERTLTGDLRHVVLRANHEGRVLAVWVVARPLPDGPALARRFRAARPEVHRRRRARESLAAATRSSPTASGDNERLLDGVGEIEDQRRRRGRDPCACCSLRAPSSRRTARSPPSPTPRSRARWRSRPTERVVDAYCGVGGIALTLARGAAEVIGIESHAGAVADATASAALNGIANARFVAGDAAQALAQIDRADVVVLNPPRKGCAPEVLARGRPPRPTRHRLSLLRSRHAGPRSGSARRRHGYRARAVTPFDMLPHTPHVEALAVLALP